MDDERRTHDVALAIDLERGAAAELGQQVHDVGGEEAARRARHAAREIGDADDGDAPHDDHLAGHAGGAVSALLRREIDDHRARLHGRDHLVGQQHGRAHAGHEGGRDDDVDLGGLRAEERDLRGEERGAHLLRVAAAALGVLDDVDVEVARAEALDLLLRRGSRVERADLCAERASRSHRGKAGDPGADDEHARRRDGAGGRDLRAERALEVLRRLDDRAIAREVRHRRQDVHFLGAGDARDALERDRRGLPRGDERRQLLVALGLQQRDEQRSLAELRDLFVRGRPDLDDDVGGAPDVRAVAERCACRVIRVVVDARAEPCALLDTDVEAQREELLHRLGRRSDPLLARRALLRDPDTYRT